MPNVHPFVICVLPGVAKLIFDLNNNYREENKIGSFKWDNSLAQIAEDHNYY